jgi:hypothetical protein
MFFVVDGTFLKNGLFPHAVQSKLDIAIDVIPGFAGITSVN